jgi:hypothetical protein
MDSEPNIIPPSHVINVRLPSSAEIRISVNTLNTTVIKASDLGLSKFKDGIYCFYLEPDSEDSGACGIYRSKIAGVFPNIDCCIDTAYSKLDETKYDDVNIVKRWIDNAKMSASLEKEVQSLSEYKTAKSYLSKLNCECNC